MYYFEKLNIIIIIIENGENNRKTKPLVTVGRGLNVTPVSQSSK